MLQFSSSARQVLRFLGFVACGCSQYPNSDASLSPAVDAGTVTPKAPLGLGSSFEHRALRVTLASQGDCANSTGPLPNDSNYRRWAAELELTNPSSTPIAVSAFRATLKDSDGFTYTTSLTGCTPLLEARWLQPGERVRGYVPFEIPKFLTSATLIYQFPSGGQSEIQAEFRIAF